MGLCRFIGDDLLIPYDLLRNLLFYVSRVMTIADKMLAVRRIQVLTVFNAGPKPDLW
jgi:hypothetical protein